MRAWCMGRNDAIRRVATFFVQTYPIEELAVRHTSTGKALDFDTLANIGEVHVACAHANTVNHSERKQLDGLFPFGDVAHMLGHQELM